jgi:uncharacterized repeat protein (TIGR01451 family)
MNALPSFGRISLQSLFLAFIAAVVTFGATEVQAQPFAKIAYVADNEIWLMNADGSEKNALGLAGTDFVAYDVQLSPDGEWVAFHGTDFDSGGSGLWVMRAALYNPLPIEAPVNKPQLVGPDASLFKRASWHPDGVWLAYLGNNNKVYMVSAFNESGELAGGAPERITAMDSPVWATDVAFDPDGRNLLVCQFDSDLAFIEVFDATGARTGNMIDDPLTPITSSTDGRAKWPSFSLDGRKILFHSIRQYVNTEDPPRFVTDNAIAVLTIRDEAGNLTPEHQTANPRVPFTTPTESLEETPTWSPSGSKIVFVDEVPSGTPGIFTKRIVAINGTEPEHATNNPRSVLAEGAEYPSFAHPAKPQPTPPITIRGEANLWLAGQPDGTPAEQTDSAPDQSPVLVPLTPIPGKELVFQVSGGTNNGPDPGTTGPDGGPVSSHSPENGIGPVTAPLNSLVGVFLGGEPGMAVDPSHIPAQPAPSAYLNFGEPQNQNLPLLQPGLREPFFIGDGLDDENAAQRVSIPAGATRLFLGSFDAYSNKENSGEFTVTVDFVTAPPPQTLPASTHFTVVPGSGDLPWMFTINQASQAAGLVLRVETTLAPDDPESWADLPTGSTMERDGDTWVLSVSNPPTGSRYFRVVAEASGYEPTATIFTVRDEATQVDVVTPFLITRRIVDTTPPVLNITHTWMEKAGKITFFKMLLDPQDETGFDPGLAENDPHTAIEYRSVLNSTAPISGNGGWKKWGWQRGVPFSVPFNCKAVVFEVQAIDAAGNKSPIQRRTFKVPFPYGPGPNLEPKFNGIVPFADNAIDCRGLFAARFDDEGPGDDVLQIDRTTGEVRVRRQGNAGAFTDNSFFLTPNSINDSAIGDFDSDGRPDIAIVVDGTLKVFRNDGVDGGGELQFSEIGVGGLAGAGIANVMHCAVGNVTSDGWPDIVITGTGDDGMGGTVTKVAVIINTPDFHLTGANNAIAPAGTDPGLVKLGDVDGDGWFDAVMVDAAGNRLLTFRNKQNGGFGGVTESDPEFQIKSVITGFPPLPAKALAVGDVTGDGRADAVVVLHHFASRNLEDPNDIRDHELWQLLDARPDGSLRGNQMYPIGEGPQGAGHTDFRSDVILSDVNGDRFPELILTSQFEAPPAPGGQPGGVLVVRLDSRLDPSNALDGFEHFETVVPTNAGNPHRLATGRYGTTGRRDIVLANGSNPQLQWIRNRYSTLSKPLEIQGGLYTESDPDGTALPNGVLTYSGYPGEFIDYTVSYANNTPNPLVNATIESVLPLSVEVIAHQSDSGHEVFQTRKNRLIRWTETIPAGGAGVKQFRVRILPATRINTAILPTNILKGGGKAATSIMPKLNVGLPLVFEFTSVSTGPNPFGLINPPHSLPVGDPTGRTTRLNDPIRWRLKITNKASIPLNGIKVHVPMPRGVKFDGPVHSIPGMTYVVTAPVANDRNPIPTKIDFTIPALGPFGSTDDLFFIDGTVVEDQGITVPVARNGAAVMVPGFQIRMQATVELPGVIKRVEPAFVTTVAQTLGIEVFASKNIASPGEIIEYTVVARNWSSSDVQNARVVNEIPYGAKLISVKTRDASGGGVHYNDSPLDASSLTTNPSTIAPGLLSSGWPTLLWDFGTVPGGAHRIMHYTVRIGADVPTEFYPGGNYKEIRIVNGTYNFTGFFSASYTYAILPSNIKTARVSNALPLTQLPARNGSKAVGTIMSAENLQPVPSLWLKKLVVGPRDESLPAGSFKYPFLASQEKGEDITYYLVNTKADTADGVMSYHLVVQNEGSATAHNVYVHDVIPDKALDKARRVATESVEFQGWVARDGNLVESFSKFRFFDRTGALIPAIDATTIASVRSMSLWAGDLAPGQTVTFTYQVQIKGEPKVGTKITSVRGGIEGKLDKNANGLNYTTKPGYYLTADELHFPVNGNPDSVIAEVSDPVKNILSKIIPRSREGLDDDQEVEIGLPYAITGAAGIRVVGSQMQFDVPAGYEVLGVRLIGKDANGDEKVVRKFVRNAAYERTSTPEWPGDHTAPAGSVTVTSVKGLSRVTVLLNDLSTPSPLTDPANPLAKGDIRSSMVFLHCRIDPAKAALLRNGDGFTNDALRVYPKISGGRPVVVAGGMAGVFEKWVKPFVEARPQGVPAVALAGGMVILQAGGAGTAVLGAPVAATSSEVLLDVRSDTEKDAKVAIGRSVPIATREGNEITYMIFVANLTDQFLEGGQIKMTVPKGCEALQATNYQFNGYSFGELSGLVSKSLAQTARGSDFEEGSTLKVSGRRWNKPLGEGKTIYWLTGHLIRDGRETPDQRKFPAMLPSECGVVTLTVRVKPGFSGSQIIDDSCQFLSHCAMDKSPGPIATTVLKGDWEAEKGRVVQGAVEGLGMQFTPRVGEVLGQGFVARQDSRTIQYGGANLLQLKPNVHGKAASLIALPFDRVFAIGHPDSVRDYHGDNQVRRTLYHSNNLAIVVGPGTKDPASGIPNGIALQNPVGLPTGFYPANTVLNKLLAPNFNEMGTLILAGGGSVVDGGAGTIADANARSVTVTLPPVNRGGQPVTTQLSGTVKVDMTYLAPAKTAPAGAADVAIAPGAAPIVPVAGGKVLSHNGNALVGQDGASLVGQDGAGVVSNDGAGVVSNDGAGLVGQDGAGVVSNDGAGVVSNDGAGIVGAGGGN